MSIIIAEIMVPVMPAAAAFIVKSPVLPNGKIKAMVDVTPPKIIAKATIVFKLSGDFFMNGIISNGDNKPPANAAYEIIILPIILGFIIATEALIAAINIIIILTRI